MFGFNFDVWHMIAFCVIYTDLRLSKSAVFSGTFMDVWLHEQIVTHIICEDIQSKKEKKREFLTTSWKS